MSANSSASQDLVDSLKPLENGKLIVSIEKKNQKMGI